jgi:nucleotide-binding universal stress UspA family protein
MFKKILVPIDGSEESRTIVRWAAGLARANKAEITLLSVIDPEEFRIVESTAIGPFSTDAPTEVIAEFVEKRKVELETEVETLRATGLAVGVIAIDGTPAETIAAEAKKLDADLIAMSTRRESALARGILGSVTDRVLHSTTTPLLILQPEDVEDGTVETGFIRRIVVPLDGSTLSEQAVVPAVALARATGAELVFTEVVRIPIYGMEMGGIGYGSVHYAEAFSTELQEEEAAKYLMAFVENAETAGLKAQAKVRTGNPSIQIVDEAAAPGSVIVMATHGAGGIKRWMIGSVTDKAIRSAHRPVLVIPPQAD